MSVISEKNVENAILAYLNNRRIFAWKCNTIGTFDPIKKVYRKSNNPYHINGISDILFIYKGRFCACEVKKPYISKKTMKIKYRTQEDLEKLASDDQLVFINRIKENGGVAFMADSLEVFIDQFNLWLMKDSRVLESYHQLPE